MRWSINTTGDSLESARTRTAGTSAVPPDLGTAELIVCRPRVCTFGALRRVRLELDGKHVADLSYGATVRIQVDAGVHMLRARCLPLWPASLPIELGPGQTMRVQTCVGAYQELQLCRVDRRSEQRTVAGTMVVR